MRKRGLCHICGSVGDNACVICGRIACNSHYDPASGACSSCRSGRKAVLPDSKRRA